MRVHIIHLDVSCVYDIVYFGQFGYRSARLHYLARPGISPIGQSTSPPRREIEGSFPVGHYEHYSFINVNYNAFQCFAVMYLHRSLQKSWLYVMRM